jgi:hypothetical protein
MANASKRRGFYFFTRLIKSEPKNAMMAEIMKGWL